MSNSKAMPVRNMSAFIRRLRWITHPITIFVSLQIVWLAITLIWVIWFVGAQQELTEMASRFGKEFLDSRTTLAILIVGCILLGVLLVGTIILFVFGQRQSSLARQQRTFVSSVTHELKSPLASLQLAFETMTSRTLEASIQSRLNLMIQSDIDRLKRLVDQILLAGRLDQGILLFDEDLQFVPIRDLINRTVESLKYLDPNLSSRVTVDCPESLSVRVSKAALMLICTNLIENAVKYSPRGTSITVAAKQLGNRFSLSVRDEGIGLTGVDRRRIFKMFQRGESAIKKAIPGTGLGLYIVKTAVKVLHGKIWAESPGPGLGTSFYVNMPMHQAHIRS
jgi:hypothetical protein